MANQVIEHDDDMEETTEVVPVDDGKFKYDPQEMLRQTGEVQHQIIGAIKNLDMDKLVQSPSALESVSSFLNGVNNTAVQTTRNNIVQSATDVGAIADAVYDKMRRDKGSNIRTVEDTGRKGRIPTNVHIDLDSDQVIETGMLQRGLIEQTFDEFAEKHDIRVVTPVE